MEFFEFADIATTEEGIRAVFTIKALPKLCDEIESVDREEPLGRVIYFSRWGRFHLRSEPICGGLRFWVPDCPNALSWTVTTGYPPSPAQIVFHVTFNRSEHSEEFLEATKALLLALKNGAESIPQDLWPQPACGQSFICQL